MKLLKRRIEHLEIIQFGSLRSEADDKNDKWFEKEAHEHFDMTAEEQFRYRFYCAGLSARFMFDYLITGQASVREIINRRMNPTELRTTLNSQNDAEKVTNALICFTGSKDSDSRYVLLSQFVMEKMKKYEEQCSLQ